MKVATEAPAIRKCKQGPHSGHVMWYEVLQSTGCHRHCGTLAGLRGWSFGAIRRSMCCICNWNKFDGLVQERGNSSALAMELRLLAITHRTVVFILGGSNSCWFRLTHRGQDKIESILPMTFSNSFSCVKKAVKVLCIESNLIDFFFCNGLINIKLWLAQIMAWHLSFIWTNHGQV